MRKKNLRKRQRALSLYHSPLVRDSMHLHAYAVNDSIERSRRREMIIKSSEGNTIQTASPTEETRQKDFALTIFGRELD